MRSARLQLHTAVVLFGLTAPLGELIDLHEVHLVWYRLALCVLFFLPYFLVVKRSLKVNRFQTKYLIITGAVLAVHWITFYGAIKLDGSELALVMFSLGPLFTAFIEPFYFKTRLKAYELLLGLLAVVGIAIIMQANTASTEGVILGLVAALLNAVYAVYSKVLVEQLPEDVVNFYTIGMGLLVLSVALPFAPQVYDGLATLALPATTADWMYLLVLSVLCTNIAYVMCLKGLQGLSAFNFMLVVNLEPIYGILLTFLLLTRADPLDAYFWMGTAVVVGAVFANIIIQQRRKV